MTAQFRRQVLDHGLASAVVDEIDALVGVRIQVEQLTGHALFQMSGEAVLVAADRTEVTDT